MLSPTILNQVRELLNVFKMNGQPAGTVMSDGQVEIAACIILKIHPRGSCLAPTGYGKSEAIAMGVIYRVVFFREPWVIGSVKYGTSDIIMERVIAHFFDDPFLLSQLDMEQDEKLARLKRERNKRHLSCKRGGAVKVVSLHGAEDDASQAIGEHVPNIVLDESPLLTPGKYLQVLKILEGTGSYDKTFLFELGNAVGRNHFMRNVKTNPAYYKIDISLEQAIAEGRLDWQSVEEKRGLPFFKEFYLCQFPDEDEIDEKGYRRLITTDEVQAVQYDGEILTEEPMRMGVDVAGGGDWNTYVIRQGAQSWIESYNRSNDTMTNVTEVQRIIDKYTVEKEFDGVKRKVRRLKPENIFLDDIGIGRGVTDRLIELNYPVNGISVGNPAVDSTKYKNIKAENYWLAAEWLKAKDPTAGSYLHKLKRDERWLQMTWIKYKPSSDKQLQIEPKEDSKKRENHSPDFAEGFMLTFSTQRTNPGITLL